MTIPRTYQPERKSASEVRTGRRSSTAGDSTAPRCLYRNPTTDAKAVASASRRPTCTDTFTWARLARALGHARRRLGHAAVHVTRRELALDLPVELDRADRVLVGELGEDLVDDADDVGLVVPEIVEKRAQRGVRHLELCRSQLEVVVELRCLRIVGAVVAHAISLTFRSDYCLE